MDREACILSACVFTPSVALIRLYVESTGFVDELRLSIANGVFRAALLSDRSVWQRGSKPVDLHMRMLLTGLLVISFYELWHSKHRELVHKAWLAQ